MLTLGKEADGQLDLKALTTHAFILGMTGAGKTGLCAVLTEELLRSKVPVIAVDSKGDLPSFFLNGASVADWAPDAPPRLAAARAAIGLDDAAYQTLLGSYDRALFTPGANLATPVDLLGSLAPPDDESTAADRADAFARSLLGLVGLEADSLSSPEYLLLVQLVSGAWSQGQTPTLADLVKLTITPPFNAVGALPLEDFFPKKDRQALAARINGLLVSPRFTAWRQGAPLDPQRLFWSEDGTPRLSIYSVAHLSPEERAFAVAQLLDRVVTWLRTQSGATTVRAVLLIDEIFGYFPPAPANPPTKTPLLTLLKQARAFGVSVVLATQNPIDLDYRGLANIGTWLVGRLQSQQDKARIRDALISAAAATDTTPAQLDDLLSTLEPRRYLLHSVHRPKPTVFTTRDALCHLRGPFSPDELKRLNAEISTDGVAPAAPAPTVATDDVVIDPALGPVWEVDTGEARCHLLLKFAVRYRVGRVVGDETVHELAFPLGGIETAAELLEGAPLAVSGVPFQQTRPPNVTLAPTPSWLSTLKAARVAQVVKDRLPGKLEARLQQDPVTGLVSGPLETQEAFIARVAAQSASSKNRAKLVADLERKRADLAQAERELQSRKAEKWLTVGSGLLGLFNSRKSTMTSVRSAVSSNRQQGNVEAKVEDLQLKISQLEQQLGTQENVDASRFVEQVVLPRSTDVQVLRTTIAWIVP